LRDILTVLASLVILVLAAALIAPPFIDWEAHRGTIDRAITRAAGTEARTEGRIGVRLLPSPRVRVDRLRLGSQAPETPSLTADFVWAEMELMPLLSGDVRFTETRVGRADIRIPVGAKGDWRVPPDLVAGAGRARDWRIDNLFVSQLLVTTQVASTGRTDQAYAENVLINGQTLLGPWRVEGLTAGVPFRLVTGAIAPDKTMQVKLSGGGDRHPRFDLDAKLALDTVAADATPAVSGRAKVLFGPPAQVAAAGIPIPVAVEATFKTDGARIQLDPVTLEAGEGGASLRMAGTGSIRTDEPRISLKMEGRRLDVDSFILSSTGQDFVGQLQNWSVPTTTIPIDLDLSLTSIGLAQEELTNAVLRGTILPGRARVERLEFVAPGETRVALEGEFGLATQGGASGRIALATNASDRFARYLERLKLGGGFLRAFEGQSLEAATDFLFDLPVVSVRNVRLKAGDATLTGNARYTAPEQGQRGRLEAQVAVQGLNLDNLPRVSSIFDATQNLDVGFILDARNVRAGNRQGAGRITARILSDGPALLVESLDIVDLAGANARFNGRIAPDGSGRIAGKVTAQRAAPLVDLLGSVWIGGVSKLVPHFLREGGLNLDVVTERATPEAGSAGLRLRTTARGTAAGGSFDADVITVDGTSESLDVRLATDNTGVWVDRPKEPLLRRPSQIGIRGTRVGSGRFNVVVEGTVGGVRISTHRPFALSAGDDVVDSGEAEIETIDITPFLVLLGDGAGVEPPVPVHAKVTLGRERDASSVLVSGRVAGNAVEADLVVRSRSDVTGNVVLDELSVPWLLASLALHAAPRPEATALWSSSSFGQAGRLVTGGQIFFMADRLDLGRDLHAQNARFKLGLTPEGLAISDLDAGLGEGRIAGKLAVARQGALATVNGEGTLRDVRLSTLAGPSPFDARLSGSLKFGSSGERMTGLVANLGGNGELRVANLRVPNADPGALERSLQRLLDDSDPLAQGRVAAVVAEELDRGPLTDAAVNSSIAIYGGGIRLFPFTVESPAGVWDGSVSYDLKTMALDTHGVLTTRTNPPGWTGSPPSVGLSWRGSLAKPVRELDAGALLNGLAAIVLQRELEKIEALEAEANERQRRQQRENLERQRERDQRAAEESARQARLRADAERARFETEQRTRAEPERPAAPLTPSSLPPLDTPMDIRPAPQIQVRPGG
jgi:uncharacterized protein involved in outer membrane biogenesis